MDQIVIKTEVQNNGEILLYYVDENGDNQEGVLTTIENIENDSMQNEESAYVLESYDELVDDPNTLPSPLEDVDPWSDEDVKRLLIFYTDNKTSFVSGTTHKKHLWAVACKTMLIGKNQLLCEDKLKELRTKYSEVRGYISKGIYVKWPFLDLCHQAFHDDTPIAEPVSVTFSPPRKKAKIEPKIVIAQETVKQKQEPVQTKEGILSIKQINTKSPDENVEQLLKVYLKYKKNFQKEHWRRDLWDKIANELGENDSEYLQKKFLNHKQHYILMYMKRKQQGPSSVNWPYMDLFDKIYSDDQFFLKKHFNEDPPPNVTPNVQPEHEWNTTQTTVLAKYYFDCYEEFEDETIPKKFLWTEVGRLIDKKPETCQTRYQMLRKEHLQTYIAGDYSLQRRIPMAIIFDNIICKDVMTVLSNMERFDFESYVCKQIQLDELVKFFYDNTELFKDKICHFVCWAAISEKLTLSIESCKHQWDELVVLYKQILEEKKEDSDLQIDWRYIELFDRIFDYGMDEDLLRGYELQVSAKPKQVVVKKLNMKTENLDKELLEERSPPKLNEEFLKKADEPRTDHRSYKILAYYMKHKEKIQNARHKVSVWDPLAKQIGLNSSECAHRFRTLKQNYLEFVQKEIDNPKVAITWPYYTLSKKVFSHRLIKNKLKNGELNTDGEEWSAKEIKSLISFFAKNSNDISSFDNDETKWGPLASNIRKTEKKCKEKFSKLREIYLKYKATRDENPGAKVPWHYYDLLDKVCKIKKDPDTLEEEHLEGEGNDEDYQCIIVLQDGQVILNNSEVLDNPELMKQLSSITNINETPPTSKWTKRTKKRLLIHYINCIRSNRGKEIDSKDIWNTISSKLPTKTSANCKKMFTKMTNAYKRADENVKNNSPFSKLLESVLKLKPKFLTSKNYQEKVYKDVAMPSEKVFTALQYYLDNIEEFVSPKFEKKYLWSQLATHISEPISKVYNKINYLKQAYNIETEEIDGEKTEFSSLLKEIIAKEVAVKIVIDVNPEPYFSDLESSFTEDETERLLVWYLANLDKFKNPKFNKSYLWKEASTILNKSPVVCSKKMSEIRSLYRNMVKQGDETNDWRFFDLCQKIYGTGKKLPNVES